MEVVGGRRHSGQRSQEGVTEHKAHVSVMWWKGVLERYQVSQLHDARLGTDSFRRSEIPKVFAPIQRKEEEEDEEKRKKRRRTIKIKYVPENPNVFFIFILKGNFIVV